MSAAPAVADPVVAIEPYLSSLRNVRKVLVSVRANQVIAVCTIIEGFDRDVRNSIYEAERRIIRENPSANFDFHVIQGDQDTEIADCTFFQS